MTTTAKPAFRGWLRFGPCHPWVQVDFGHATVNWRFTTDKARIKLKRLYPSIQD